MSSSAPETCSASDDFEKNSLGRYGIQPYQFEPRVETVTFVGALEQLETLREKTRGVFHLPRDSGNSGWVVNGT